jgi:putative transposase
VGCDAHHESSNRFNGLPLQVQPKRSYATINRIAIEMHKKWNNRPSFRMIQDFTFVSLIKSRMPSSFNKLWIHSIWSTKNRVPLIDPSIESKIYSFMEKQFVELGCPVKNINGIQDHIHCLFMLNPQRSPAEIIKQVKGSTSHYINQNNLIKHKFGWQTGYASFSVSESAIPKVNLYISNQKEHHTKRTFQEELDLFLRLYGLS